ncbi:hypothetical protein ACQEU3_46630 [Spirillospora sp. CA-253888]
MTKTSTATSQGDRMNEDVTTATGAQIGDVVMLFRLTDAENSSAHPRLMKDAVLAALRQAGLLETKDAEQDARDIAEFLARGAMDKPKARVLGRSGWNR